MYKLMKWSKEWRSSKELVSADSLVLFRMTKSKMLCRLLQTIYVLIRDLKGHYKSVTENNSSSSLFEDRVSESHHEALLT